MGDNKGQVSMEYLLIFVVSLIIMIIFTLPLVDYGMKTTLDVGDSLKIKSDLSEIASAIKTVYNEGQGSRQTVNIQSDRRITVDVESRYISGSSDYASKPIKVPCRSNLESSSFIIKKANNVIVVEWPVGSENMQIYTTF
jgi:uncharacterized protein (UPF0333 family)